MPLSRREVNESMSSVEIEGFGMPSDMPGKWQGGQDGFWLTRVGRDGNLHRFHGVYMADDGWLRCMIDVNYKERYAHITAPLDSDKVHAAQMFIENYGGEPYYEGQPIDLDSLEENNG